jgi:hypothetical protein
MAKKGLIICIQTIKRLSALSNTPFGKSGDMTWLTVLSLQVLPSYPICSAKGA